MPRNPYTTFSNIFSESNRLALFSGRERELSIVRSIVNTSAAEQDPTSEKIRILHFYGLSGVGKSLFLRKAISETTGDGAIKISFLDLNNLLAGEALPKPDFLWLLRQCFFKNGIKTPLYDYFYVSYFAVANPGLKLQPKNLLCEIAANFRTVGNGIDATDAAEIPGKIDSYLGGVFDAEFISECLVEIGDRSKSVTFFVKVQEAIQKRRQKQKLARDDLDLSTLSAASLCLAAPRILAIDLLEHLERDPNHRLTVAIDGLERIQSNWLNGNIPTDAESALEELIRWLLFADQSESSRFRILTLGRESLNWHEKFSTRETSASWTELVSEHMLLGLNEIEAKTYIHQLSGLLDQEGFLEDGQSLRSLTNDILQVAREQQSDSDNNVPSATFHPFTLSLAIQTVLERGSAEPRVQLGQSLPELKKCFLSTLSQEKRHLLEILALVCRFNEDLYQRLYSARLINQPIPEAFPLLVTSDPLIRETANATEFELHSILQVTLLENLASSKAGRETLRRLQDTVYSLLMAECAFKPLIEIGPQNLTFLSRVFNTILSWHSLGLLSLRELCIYWFKAENMFGSDCHHQWSLRRPPVDYLLRTILALSSEVFTELSKHSQHDNDEFSFEEILIGLANLLRNNNEIESSEALWAARHRAFSDYFQSLSEDARKFVLEESANNINSTNLIIQYALDARAREDFDAAASLYESALAFLKKFPSDTIKSCFSIAAKRGLAICLERRAMHLTPTTALFLSGDFLRVALRDVKASFEVVERLYQEALREMRESSGDQDLQYAVAQLEYVHCLLLQNKSHRAEKILGQAAKVIESQFPRDHIHRAALLRFRALALFQQNKLEDSLCAAERAAEMYSRLLGESNGYTIAVRSEIDSIREKVIGLVNIKWPLSPRQY